MIFAVFSVVALCLLQSWSWSGSGRPLGEPPTVTCHCNRSDHRTGAAAAPTLSATQYDALEDLYTATHGVNWHYPINGGGAEWNFTNPTANPCADNWVGVSCTCGHSSCFVARLNLTLMNLTGTLPSTLADLASLNILELRENYISGSIPDNIGQMGSLSLLDLSLNNLDGAVPASLYDLDQLVELDLAANYLKDILSPAIGNLTRLKRFDISGNFFYGTLPSALGQLTELYGFGVASNYFVGPIPPAMGSMTSLVHLNMQINPFATTIPDALCNLTSLHTLWIYRGELKGTLPPCLGNLSQLTSLDLSTNFLDGRIPESFNNLGNLSFLLMPSNLLTGPVPDLSDMHHLGSLWLGDNLLTGSLPVGDWPGMEAYNLNGNHFHGSIPDALYDFECMASLTLSNNSLTGSLSEKIGNMINITYIIIGECFLTGTLPQNISLLSQLTELYLPTNHLHGTIPEGLGGLTFLTQLYLDVNHLTGTFPVSITNLPNLEVLYLYFNELTGTMDNFFAGQSRHTIENIDFSHNRFTGSLPVTINRLQRLLSFASAANCLSGTVPVEFCQLPDLQTLALDGVSTSGSCRKYIFPAFKKSMEAFQVKYSLVGTIPPCLFSMLHIQSLHLSGNGLTGSLPADLQLAPGLIDIVLSHNALTGPIPASLQLQNTYTLDLGYNHFGGTLLSTFSVSSANTSITLKVNQLSGHIPDSLIHADSVDILNGNMFSCDAFHEDLPRNDPSIGDYSCGSNDVNRSLYTFLGVAGTLMLGMLCLVVIARRKCSALREYLTTLLSTWKIGFQTCANEIHSTHTSISSFVQWMGALRQLFSSLSVFLVVIMIPAFSALSSISHTYEHKYAWNVSAVLMAGSTAAWSLAACFCVTLAVFIVVIYLLIGIPANRRWLARNSSQVSMEMEITPVKDRMQEAMTIFILTTVNIIAMIVLDIGYVLVFIHGSTVIVVATQVVVAVIKIWWNELIVWRVLLRTKSYLKAYFQDDRPNSIKYSNREVLAIVFNVLLNSIIAPCLAVAGVTSSCFYNALAAAASVVDNFIIYQCGLVMDRNGLRICLFRVPLAQQVEYDPPFAYSYQCSSTMSINYTPVYVYMFIILGLIMPLAKLITRAYNLQHSQETAGGSGAGAEAGMELKTQETDASATAPPVAAAPSSAPSPVLAVVVNPVSKLLACWRHFIFATSSEQSKPLSQRYQPAMYTFFYREKIIVRFATALSVMLSFGVIFPPLAMVIGIAAVIMLITEQTMIGMILVEARGRHCEQLDVLARECKGVMGLFRRSTWLIIPFGAVMQAYLVFDTMGYKHGLDTAILPAMVVLVFPFLAGALIGALNRRLVKAQQDSVCSSKETVSTQSNEGQDAVLRESTIEMQARPSRLDSQIDPRMSARVERMDIEEALPAGTSSGGGSAADGTTVVINPIAIVYQHPYHIP